ncbi:MAG: FHA domain-containing protein [Planctomycetes bacterium]|nr:FHA domain-containing protein [Planctomycetota bacterium]
MQGRPSAAVVGSRSTLVSPAGSGGLRARLVRGAGSAAEPFVVVHEGRYARILLAELVGDDGVAQSRFAWKLRVDRAPVGTSSARTPPTNAELDRQWQLERDELLRVHSPHVVASVAVPAALTQSLPVFYCRRAACYFHPVCPDTGAPLSVCRDDAVLQAAGLPPYAADTVRYLHHGRADGPPTFYRIGEAEQRGATRIADLPALIRGWARIAHGDQPSPELPCQTCEHRATCYPGGDGEVPAERELHAVSFYDVDSIALELAATDFDTAITRLGGGLPPERGTRSWMAGGDVRGRALEALRLKLAAFADVCRGVRDVHDGGRPHLGISPANIVAFDCDASSLPANWRMRFALTDLGGARPVRLPSPGGDEVLWQPGRQVSEDEVSRRFLSPTLRALEGGSVTMSVACRSLPDVDGGSQLVIDVHRAGVPSFVLPGDLLLVQPSEGGATVSARVDEVVAKGLQATVRDAGGAERWAGTTFDARLSFARRSGPSADLYGLGVLLLRMLLVHDEQSLEEVSDAVERCVNMMTNSAATDDGTPLADMWHEILEGEHGGGRFGAWNVMHGRADRQLLFDAELQGRSLVPKPVWQSLLALAGRLLLASPIARGDGPDGVARPMDTVLAEVERLERQLHVELFDREARDAAIARVCAHRAVALRGELGDVGEPLETMPAPAPGASSPLAAAIEQADAAAGRGFVLAIGRVGEATVQQYHFSQERVTIGRREGDNLLLLADPMVSSKHAVIEFSDGEYVLFDRGSTNGTEVDGIRLPVEVPHPLDDGSVIHIRPFMLSFRRAETEATQLMAVPLLSVDEVFEQLCSAYAEAAGGGEQELHAALGAALDAARASLGRTGLLQSLEAILERVSPGEPATPATPATPAAPATSDPMAQAALRAVRQLARTLTEGWELETDGEVQEFAGRVQRFVDVTANWIEEMLEWRRLFGERLELRATQAGGARPPLRSAGEVRAELLRPSGEVDGAAASDYFLTRFFDDVLAILEDLVEGNQRVRQAVRERLDPDRLVAEAGREARLSLLVKTAASSALWKLYEDTFAEVTASGDHEDEVRSLLATARARRGSRS